MKFQRNRMLRLARRLIRVEKKHFDLNHWYNNETGNTPKEIKTVDGIRCLLKEGFCGSIACVLGTAALIPEFQRYGLTISLTMGNMSGDVIYKKRGDKYIYRGGVAGAEFFGIPQSHAYLLFYAHAALRTPDFYTGEKYATSDKVTPQLVAIRLIEYVETKGKNVQDWLDTGRFQY